MKGLILSLLPLLAYLSAVPAFSQPLTLEQAQVVAAKNNPDFLAAQKRLGIRNAEITTAGALPNPSFISDNGIAEKTYRVGLQQTILLGGDRKKRIALAEAQRDVALAELQQALLELRAETRQAYTRLYFLKERQSAYQSLADLTQQLLGTAKKREQAGDIANVDVLQAQLMALEAKNDLRAVSYELIQAKNRLGTLLNTPNLVDMELSPPADEPDLLMPSPELSEPAIGTTVLKASVQKVGMDPEKLVELALQRRPEVQGNLRMQEVTHRQKAVARAERIPDLTIAAGPDIITEPGQQQMNIFVVGSVEIPLFNRQQGPMLEAEARRTQLKQELEAVRNRIRLEVNNAYTAYEGNRALLEQYSDELLPTAQALVEKAQLAFQEGKTSVLFPINAQQAYVKTRMGYLQSLKAYQQAITDLEKAIGSGL